MIINSSNVGMESARTYRSTTTRTLSFSAKTTLYSLTDNALGNQDLLGTGNEESLKQMKKVLREKVKQQIQLMRQWKDYRAQKQPEWTVSAR